MRVWTEDEDDEMRQFLRVWVGDFDMLKSLLTRVSLNAIDVREKEREQRRWAFGDPMMDTSGMEKDKCLPSSLNIAPTG